MKDREKLLQVGIDFRSGKREERTWNDLNNSMDNPFANGESYRGFTKKQLKKLGKLPSKERVVSEEVQGKLDEVELKINDLKSEKIKLQDQRREYNKIIREKARFEAVLEEFENIIDKANKIKPLKVDEYVKINSENEMVVVFTDWHYGLFADNHWNFYDANEFHRRLEKYLNKIISIGREHNVSKVHVLNLGDMIQGNIHLVSRVTNVEDVIMQTQNISESMAEMLLNIAKNFSEVNYHSVVGNHGRVNANKQEAMSTENFEYMIDWYLKGRLQDIKNIHIIKNEEEPSIIKTTICGSKVFATHGDKDKISNVVSNMSLMFKEIPDYVYLGHLHHFAVDTFHDVQVIMSGSLSGTDEYAKDIRRSGKACQTITIMNKEKEECIYNIKLN